VTLLRAFRAERLKLRRSYTASAIVAGGLFVPAIMLAVRLHQNEKTAAMIRAGNYWMEHWKESWESISILILPLLTILVTTLIVQIEHRNNTWKQLHASPLSLPVIYLAKLAVLLVALAEIFVVISAGLFLAGWIPMRGGWNPFPAAELLLWNARFFLDMLPVVGIQYLLALTFRNFLAPMGAGVAGWILGLVVINSRYVIAVPYAYAGVDYLIRIGHRSGASLPDVGMLSAATFLLSVAAGFSMYALARDRGMAQ